MKLIYIISGIFMLSGCLQFWTDPKGYFAGYKTTPMTQKILYECRKEAEKKYANDTSENVEGKIIEYRGKCYHERLPWWW